MADDVSLELAFLLERLQEVRNEVSAIEARDGVPMTADSAAQMKAELLTQLREAGNEPLAAKYARANDRLQEATKTVTTLVARGEANEAARQDLTDALDDWERVLAEVGAWAERRQKGGA